jgi:general secretion pathway protein N
VKASVWIALLAAITFVVIVIARMPAAWVLPRSYAQASCASIDGSLWNGSCAGLAVSGKSLGDVSWELRPLKLFAGRLGAHVTLAHGPVVGSSDVELGFGQRITARNLIADVPLDPRLIPSVPSNLSGEAHLNLALAEVQRGVITQLKGRIEAHDLQERSGASTPLGSYVLTFPGGSGDPVGQLRDLDGPLALEGTLRLTRQPGFELEGVIATRSGAPPELVNNIRFLGSPDASGRRPFSLSGTF